MEKYETVSNETKNAIGAAIVTLGGLLVKTLWEHYSYKKGQHLREANFADRLVSLLITSQMGSKRNTSG